MGGECRAWLADLAATVPRAESEVILAPMGAIRSAKDGTTLRLFAARPRANAEIETIGQRSAMDRATIGNMNGGRAAAYAWPSNSSVTH